VIKIKRIFFILAAILLIVPSVLAELEITDIDAWVNDLKQIDMDRKLARKALAVAEHIEGSQRMHCVGFPGIFNINEDISPRYVNTEIVPPIMSLPEENTEKLEEGIYVSTTGIPGLEKLYKEVENFGLKLYSNDTEVVVGSEEKSPQVISNEKILFQFARAGWGAIWRSLLSETLIVSPAFDPKDDLEIYFNNIIIEKLGIDTVISPVAAFSDEITRFSRSGEIQSVTALEGGKSEMIEVMVRNGSKKVLDIPLKPSFEKTFCFDVKTVFFAKKLSKEEIDKMVYELYGLTDEEIKIVVESVK